MKQLPEEFRLERSRQTPAGKSYLQSWASHFETF